MNRIEDPITEKLRKEPGTATYTFYRIFIGDRAGIAETDAKELVQSIKSFGGSVGIKNFSEVYLHDNESMASLYSTFQLEATAAYVSSAVPFFKYIFALLSHIFW